MHVDFITYNASQLKLLDVGNPYAGRDTLIYSYTLTRRYSGDRWEDPGCFKPWVIASISGLLGGAAARTPAMDGHSRKSSDLDSSAPMLARRFLLQTSRGFATKAAAGQWLASVPMGPADPILGLTERFNKVNPPQSGGQRSPHRVV
ncbi:hypothetical protein ON010_g9901 [Phytophthora cinnamomi]|nr:hypothetical protein ON010_g9901 [Phytophthora cinnamomi]